MLRPWSLPKQKEIVLIFLKFYNTSVKIFIKNLIFFTLMLPLLAVAGTIEGDQYAWGENVGWVNFGTEQGEVTVTDNALTGYAWDAIYGWINLAPEKAGVFNDGAGNLSGQAWSQNAGWIDFAGVTIDTTSGRFSGLAEGDIYGRLNFDCSHCGVVTDWRPASSVTETPTETSTAGPSGNIVVSPPQPKVLQPLATKILEIELVEKIKKALAILVPGFVKTRLFGGDELDLPLSELLSKQTPLALKNPSSLLSPEPERFALSPAVKSVSLALKAKWQVAPREASKFALQGLPKDVALLTNKFPQVGRVLNDLGVDRMSDVKKLQGLRLAMPSFSKLFDWPKAEFGVGKMALVKNLPASELSLVEKEKMPSEIVFARAFEERIDLKSNLTFDPKGQPTQEIQTIVGKRINLVVKPDAPAQKVTGYIILAEQTEKKTAFKTSMNLLVATAAFVAPELAKSLESKLVEKVFVLSEFEYHDEDKDGIYTADVETPAVAGEYRIITVVDYLNPDLGAKEIRLSMVVDPEGYVFAKNGLYETRISKATVTLWWFNPAQDEYQIWPAKEYLQENPQVTDSRGTYSFLVPEGVYYITTVAPGFEDYQSDLFDVTEGDGIHLNIELKPKGSWFFRVNWELAALVVIALAVIWGMVVRPMIRQRNKR